MTFYIRKQGFFLIKFSFIYAFKVQVLNECNFQFSSLGLCISIIKGIEIFLPFHFIIDY